MRSVRVGVAGCCVVLLACGGITQRQVDEDGDGGSGSAGSNSHTGRSGSSSSAGRSTAAGSTSAAAGSLSAAAGKAVSMPVPEPERAACFNDTDCPGSACGGQVCNWTLLAPMPVGEKVFACNPAGSQSPTGRDGWCTTDDNCKCRGEGAQCIVPYCTFTR